MLKPQVCSFLVKRTKHSRFFANQTERCNRFLNNLTVKQNKKIKSVLEPAKVMSSGVPSFLHPTEGPTRLPKRRQAMLNQNFMQFITDLLANNAVGRLHELEVEITQVEVTRDYQVLNVFWTSGHSDLMHVDEQLRMLKGSLHKLMIEQKFMSLIPQIQFVHDEQSSGLKSLLNVMSELDYGKDFKPTDPAGVKTFSELLTGPGDEVVDDGATMETSEETAVSKRVLPTRERVEEVPRFVYPKDMQLNVLGLDYETIMNKVLFNMRKSRAAHRNYNPESKVLPPAEWVAPPIFRWDQLESERGKEEETPDQRIKLMKNFLTNNRKKRQKLTRTTRERQLEHEHLIFENAEQAMLKCREDGLGGGDDHYEDDWEEEFEYSQAAEDTLCQEDEKL